MRGIMRDGKSVRPKGERERIREVKVERESGR